MKVAEILTEMAKSKTKRKREAKRSRQKKAKKPTMDALSNPVAKFARTSGAGSHTDKTKYKRKEKHTKDYMD